MARYGINCHFRLTKPRQPSLSWGRLFGSAVKPDYWPEVVSVMRLSVSYSSVGTKPGHHKLRISEGSQGNVASANSKLSDHNTMANNDLSYGQWRFSYLLRPLRKSQKSPKRSQNINNQSARCLIVWLINMPIRRFVVVAYHRRIQ